MRNFKSILLIGNLLLVLIVFNSLVYNKEMLMKEGKVFYLELTPLDPRSLMQGDYMSLNFKLENTCQSNQSEVYVVLNQKSIAQNVVLKNQRNTVMLGVSGNEFKIPHSFLFQEGSADRFSTAKFAGFKTNGKGDVVLFGLFSEKLVMIK